MFRRSIKLPGIRPEKAGPRTNAAPPGSGLSYALKEESRIVGFKAQASNLPLTSSSASEKDWSELLWLGLIMLAIAATAVVQVMQ